MLSSATLVVLLACQDDAASLRTVTEVLVPPGIRLFIDEEFQLQASPRDKEGGVMYGVGCSWSSSDPTVAPVAEDGTVTGISAGLATITATCDGVGGSAQVEVRHLILEKLDSGSGELYGQLYASWGTSATDLFAVGGDSWCWDICFGSGIILHYQGTSWETMPVPDGTESLLAVWGTSAHDVFAVGDAGTILHYDGADWIKMLQASSLGAVWGSSAEDVFAAGEGILHYDGQTWSTVSVPEGSPFLSSIWGSSSTDVFAVGLFGTILHYDGLAWKRMQAVSSENLLDVWGASSDDVFVVGEGGTVLHYDGVAWGQISVPTTDDLNGIWGPSPNEIYVVGTNDPFSHLRRSVILHYDETGWGMVEAEIPKLLAGLWGTTEDVLFVGDGPTILRMRQ